VIHWLKQRGAVETVCGIKGLNNIGPQDEVVTMWPADQPPPSIEPECQKCRAIRDDARVHLRRGQDIRFAVFAQVGQEQKQIGRAWYNRDGTITLALDSLPVDGKMTCRPDPAPRPSAPRPEPR
jgi:hypothetical protein